MDIISFNEAATANGRIEKFIKDPDSDSGIVTTPAVIGTGETVTIPSGRIATLPNLQIDGTLNVDGEVFIPSGSTLSGTVTLDTPQTITEVKTFTKSPKIPDAVASDEPVSKAQLDAGAVTAGTGLQKSGTTLNFYPFGLTTASTGLTTSDYVVVSDSTTPKKITLSNFANELPLLGVGQTWQKVTASRNAGVTYTNTTGKPILVLVAYAGAVAEVAGYVNGASIVRNFHNSAGQGVACVSILVPNGSTYKITSAYGGKESWTELR